MIVTQLPPHLITHMERGGNKGVPQDADPTTTRTAAMPLNRRYRLGAFPYRLSFAVHRILEQLERVEARVIVRAVDDSLDRPAVHADLFGERVEQPLLFLLAQPDTQALKVIHMVFATRLIADEVILDIYASRRKANMTCLLR